MANPINLTIYGANENYIASETPLITNLSGLSGLASVTLECYDLGAELKLESEQQEYADGHIYFDNSIYGIYKVRIKYRRYPLTATTWATQYPELAVLKLKYLWIISTNYNIGFSVSNTTRAVNLTGWNNNVFHDLVSLEITLEHRKAE